MLGFSSPSRRQAGKKSRKRWRRPLLQLESLEKRELLTGTWTPLASSPPDNTGTMLLLTDGTVMVQGGSVSKHWYKLTPNSSGSYINGSFTALATMSIERLYGGTAVLPNGKVLYVGGEFTGPSQMQTETNTGEIYDPIANTWAPIANFPESNFGDAPVMLLANGNVLGGYTGGPQTFLYNPQADAWTTGGLKVHNDATSEEGWIKLPDGSILEADINASNASGIPMSQRYIPKTNSWVDAGTIPVPLTDSNQEIGPGLLLQDGRAFQAGDTGHTALYNPATNSWTAGPNIPGNQASDDAPGAILPNGHVIFAGDTLPLRPPAHLFEYDPVANSITQMTLPDALNASLAGGSAYFERMLMLPTGDLLFSSGGSQLWDYNPNATAPAALQPTVSSVTFDKASQTYTLTGTQLNGFSEGASFGDDATMASNYPIVRVVGKDGVVHYARTFNWTSQIATGSTPVTTQFKLPAGLPLGVYTLTVVANGIPSAPFTLPVGLTVSTSTPAAGASQATPPSTYNITFSQPVDPNSLQANGFTVDGIAATGVTLDSTGTIATYTFGSNPVTAQGAHHIALASGAATLLGDGSVINASYSATFYYDALSLAITSTSPASGATLPPPAGGLTYDVTFNEPIDPHLVAVSNLTVNQGTVTAATLLAGNQTVAYTINGLNEGPLTVSMASGTIEDQYDNPASPPLSASYLVDNGTVPLPAPTSVAPLGSLVYGTSASSVLLFMGDTDQFTLTADPGQTLTVVVTPTNRNLIPAVQVKDPSGTVLGTALTSGAGQAALVQTVSTTTSGTYTIAVSALGGTQGTYNIQVTLDAALGTNATSLAAAQNLNNSFANVGGASSRGAVEGIRQIVPDYYAFSLSVGDSVALGLKSLGGSSLTVTLEDRNGAILASGVGGAASFDQLIADYMAPAAGTYYAVVNGASGTSYNLVVARNTALDTRTNGTFGSAQDVTFAQGALGALNATSADLYRVTLFGSQNALLIQTATPLGGPGQVLNTLNPSIQLYDASDTLVATGTPIADGRNQSILATGLTPSATYYVNVTAANSVSGEYFVSVTSPVAITTPTLPNWTAGHPGFNQTISATSVTGSGGSLTFSAAGTLPPGLSLSTAGVLAGTPNLAGTYVFTITATDSSGVSGSKGYSVVISPPVSITSATLPNGTLSTNYNQSIATSGGTIPLTFSAMGTLPPGLSLSTAGVLSGTFTATGSYTFTVSVSDSVGVSDSHSYTLAVFALGPSTLPHWTVNIGGFNQTFTASGGNGPYTFSATGSLASGLSLSSSGVLSGTPTSQGVFNFTLTATDSTSVSAAQAYTLVINPPVMMLPTSLAAWTLNAGGYKQTIFAAGGTGSLTFSAGTALPAGLTLSTAGVLTGTPTAAGTYNFTVSATDALGASASMGYTVTINTAITFSPVTAPPGTAIAPYNVTVTALGGTGNKLFNFSFAQFVSGLFIQTTVNSTFAIRGTPNSSGTEMFTVTATDNVGATSSLTYSVVINPALTIQTTALSNATIQTAYSQTISLSGGTAPVTFTNSGTLPTGLNLGSNGVLSGTPSATGTYAFTVNATDSAGAVASRSYMVIVNPPLTITTSTLSDWTINQPTFNQTIQTAGGTGTPSFTVTIGTLPPGKLLSSSGILVGTPTAVGSVTFTLTAMDSAGATASQTFTIVINPPVGFATSTLAPWTVSAPGYNQTIVTTGGTGTEAFTESGALPSGLTLSSAGALSGTPTAAGSFTFTVTATDITGDSGSQDFTVTVNPPVMVVPANLPADTINAAYNQAITAAAGTGPATLALSGVAGNIPGLALSGSGTGTITVSGTPTATGTETFTVTATDSVGASASQTFTLVVNPALAITTTSLATSTVGATYSQTIGTTGGTAPVTFTAPASSLPPGLTLNSSGVITGTPTAAGSFSFTVSAEDAAGSSTSQTYTVTINPALMLTNTTLSNWTVNIAGYSQALTTTGGTGSITFSAAGTLPTGLSLSSSGVLSGTPTATGSYTFAVTATDTVGGSGSQTYTVTINPVPALSPGVLPSAPVNVSYNKTITASGGTGVVTLTVSGITGAIPGLKVPTTSTGTLSISGTPTAPGTESFVVTATDAVGATVSQNYSITITPATVFLTLPGSGFSASPGGIIGSFPISINQLQDQASTNHVGLASATLAITFPTGVFNFPIGSNRATANVNLGSVPLSDTVSPGGAADWTLSANSPADGQLNITLTAKSGKNITTDNPANGGSLVTINFPVSSTYSPTSPAVQTITVAAASGTVHTSITGNNGAYLFKPAPPYVGSITIYPAGPLQVLPGSFTGSSSGFSLQFNQPYLVNSVTPVLYGHGFGATGTVPSVIVTTDPANLNDLAARVSGSLVLDQANNRITFVTTDTSNLVESKLDGGPASPVLRDGVYTVILRSTAANNGFQGLFPGVGYLDGQGSGTAGSGDFVTSFTVNAAAAGEDVVWIPPTADGPGEPLSAPGMNQVNNGYPIYLTDSTGNVTDVQLTLNYDPTLLNVTGVTGAGFSLLSSSTPGQAVLEYNGAALPAGAQVSIGALVATVPSGTAGSPEPYKAKNLLHLSNVALNGGAVPVVTSDAVHLVAYVGDADGSGGYSANDAVLITRALLDTDSGFSAYPLVDPVIVADTDGSGFIPADAALQANEAGVGLPAANLPVPAIPSGVMFQQIGNNVDPTLSLPVSFHVGSDGTVAVPVNIDDAHPAGSTGLIEAHLALTYDPSLFTVSAADVHAGSLLAGSDWKIVPTIDQTTGQIGIALSSTTPITSTAGGSLVIITFHLRGESPVGSASEVSADITPIQLVAAASPNGVYVATELEDAQGTFTLTPAPANRKTPGALDRTGQASPRVRAARTIYC
jgi:hypothetical protein